MSDDDKIDFSALDPARDRDRFERVVRGIAARASRRRSNDALSLALRFWRPALALAACAALALWAPAALRGSGAEARSDPAAQWLGWAESGGPDSAAELLRAQERTP